MLSSRPKNNQLTSSNCVNENDEHPESIGGAMQYMAAINPSINTFMMIIGIIAFIDEVADYIFHVIKKIATAAITLTFECDYYYQMVQVDA
jgi:hypothetical protein